MLDLQERVDYWLDYYAFLGVPQDAPAEDIHKAIRQIKAATHPDSNRHATEDMKSIFNRLRQHAEQAEGILENPEKRAELDNFKREHPKRMAEISPDGRIIIPYMLPLNREAVDIAALLDDTPQRELSEEEKARWLAMSGVPAPKGDLKTMRIAYKVAKDDPDVRAAYREALENALFRATIETGSAWSRAGMTQIGFDALSLPIGNPHQPQSELAIQLKEAKETIIPAAIENKAMLLLSGKSAPLLLAGPDGTKTALSTLTEADISALSERARENFDRRAHRIKAKTEERAKLMAELFEFANTYELVTDAPNRDETLIHLVNDLTENPARILASIKVITQKGTITECQNVDNYVGMTLEEATNAHAQTNAHAIGIMPEMVRDVNAHLYHMIHKLGLEKTTERMR